MPYIPTINDGSVRTLADWNQFYNSSGQMSPIIELMNQDNTILDDVLWKEATDHDGNRTTLRTELPTVYWRRLYRGIDVSKSKVSIVKDPLGMLEARSMIDAKMLQLHRGREKEYRLSEARAFAEAMRQQLATAIFYGDIKGNPDSIHGLDPRYAFKNSPHVIDAGGSGSTACTSIWGVVWGENDVTGIFPKESKAGLEHKELAEYDAFDADGKAFRAVGDLFEWNVGLSLRDWRSVVRICNIPVAKLTAAKGETGFIDLHRLTIIAKNMVPTEKRMRMKWYVNSEVMTALELQASDKGNVTLHYGELFNSKGIPLLHGMPVRQCDALLNTEAPLAAIS